MHWNRLRALEFVGGDAELLRQMTGLFLQRNGQLLGRLEAAVVARDAAALCEAAHAYKGAVNHFAAPAVREIALALENAGRNDELDTIEELWNRLQTEANLLRGELQQAFSRES